MIQILSSLLFLISLANGDLICPDGYEKQPDHDVCYRIYIESLTRSQASQKCSSDGATLLEIPNAFTSTLVKSKTRNLNNFWIGATCTDNSPSNCIYDTGRRVFYNDFYKGSVDQKNGGPCVLMFPEHSHSWSSYRCDYHAFFICQFDGTRALFCPSGYSLFSGNCYKAINGTSEENQERECESEGGHLSSVHSIGENTYLSDIVPQYYISSTKVTTLRLGMIRDGKKFTWIDGSSVDYFNMASTRPSGSCVEMPFNLRADKQSWKTAECKNNVPAVCKRAATVATTTKPTTKMSTKTIPVITTEQAVTSTSTSTLTPTTSLPSTTASTTRRTSTATTPSTTSSTTKPVTTTPTTTTATSTKVQTTSTASPSTTTIVRSSGCDEGILQAPGTIWSPNFPNNYKNNEYCLYHLEAPEGQRVELTFSTFDTEHRLDVVSVFDGEGILSPLIGSFAGTRLPPKMTSEGNRMTVLFTTDPMNRYPGFMATFTAV